MNDVAQKSLVDALGIQPGVVLRTFGMRRSGNHAIINWLLRNAHMGSIFLNNCSVGRPARRTWRSIEVNGRRANITKGDPISRATSKARDGALVIVSYEDFSPDPDEMDAAVTADMAHHEVTHEVLFYRDFMNWSASLLKKIQSNDDLDTLDCLRIMMVSLEKYREMLRLITQAKTLGVVPVNYDRWLTRPVYREKVLETLGLPCKDNSLGKVQPYGGGSSFQKEAVNASELKSDQRWLVMANDAAFQIVLLAASQDQELTGLMKQIMPKDAELLSNYLDQAQFPYIVQVGDA